MKHSPSKNHAEATAPKHSKDLNLDKVPLVTDRLGMTFGGLKAVQDVNIKVQKNEIVGLIGPNGAGKTTCFNMITGVYTPSHGNIEFFGQSIGGQKPAAINRKGIARTFQNIRLFKQLTVFDNVRVAMHSQITYGLISTLLRNSSYRQQEAEIAEKTQKLLEIFDLKSRATEIAGSLPYGEQRKLEIVRALATSPKLLLLDEPAAGMNPQETALLTQLIRRVKNEFGLSILLIEHDMSLVMKICERIYVLDYGKEIAHGTPQEIQSNKDVIKAYLGEA